SCGSCALIWATRSSRTRVATSWWRGAGLVIVMIRPSLISGQDIPAVSESCPRTSRWRRSCSYTVSCALFMHEFIAAAAAATAPPPGWHDRVETDRVYRPGRGCGSWRGALGCARAGRTMAAEVEHALGAAKERGDWDEYLRVL